jgi:hypothetical protein
MFVNRALPVSDGTDIQKGLNLINNAIDGKLPTTAEAGNYVMANAGNVQTALAKLEAGVPPVPGATPPTTETTTEDTMKKMGVPVAVGGVTTLGLKFGLKKSWGISVAAGVLTGGLTHYFTNKKEETKTA